MSDLNPFKSLSKILGALGPKPPKAAKPPRPMPVPDDEAAEAARRRSIAEMQGRSGRQSTILTDDDRLG